MNLSQRNLAPALAATGLAIILALAGCSAPAPVADPTPSPTQRGDGPTEPAAGFTLVTDDSKTISAEVPSAWAQVDGTAVTDTTYQLSAAPDLGGFAGAVHAAYDAPGLTILATQDNTVTDDEYIEKYVTEFGPDCSDGETDVYDDGQYRGKYLILPGCGTANADVVIVVAHDYANTGIALVSMTLVSDEDKEATRNQILTSFNISF